MANGGAIKKPKSGKQWQSVLELCGLLAYWVINFGIALSVEWIGEGKEVEVEVNW